jgi:hypothetical protein
VESTSGGADALQLVFQSTAKPDEIANYYRAQFSRPGWSIVSDLTDSGGAIAMYVDWTATNQPMWVRIVPNEGGTRIELTGAVPTRDSSYVRRSALPPPPPLPHLLIPAPAPPVAPGSRRDWRSPGLPARPWPMSRLAGMGQGA